MGVVARSIAGQPVERAGPAMPVTIEGAVTVSRQGHLYFLPRLGVCFMDIGPQLSLGGQIGYGNDSEGKGFLDVLMINFDESFNIIAIYEPRSKPFYWQFGLGFVSNTYGNREDDEEIHTSGVGIRLGLGYNYNMGKYLLIRPAVELNLGFKAHQSNYSINLNFGFKTPNLW